MSVSQDIRVPDIGDFKEVVVIELLVAAGDVVSDGQGLIVVETDKAAMEIPAPGAGVIRALHVAVGDKVSEGSLIGALEGVAAVPPEAPKAEPVMAEPVSVAVPVPVPVAEAAPARQVSGELPFASPSVRKLGRELGVALGGIRGSGPRGRITKADVHAHVQGRMTQEAAPRASGFDGLLPWPQVDFARFGPVERQPLSRIRKLSGANLHRNWVSIPHVTNHDDADITELEAFRQKLNREFAGDGTKVTLLALLMKACSVALGEFPTFNASLEGDELVLKRYCHIGFAADTAQGLVVPVIRDVERKGVLAIAREMAELSAKAREGKLGSAEMSGGCFTISSLGGIGGSYFTPIINAPEVAILGVGKSRTVVAWEAGGPVPRLMLPLSLSWDHRVVDGAEAGRFNACLVRLLGDYRRLLL
ncbi:dihydrolipoyllysine-residue acetyltransferase [Pseudomonas entomophila]|uniref:dihydrolipoyllysine-residue acetyltransferase n=1 Tax=Pseudomonas entomophila TaxID=312306 RepID=UPI0023D8326D|nr:dihydrolipoyllysine-residue acetyltransferase [Pseudomonas entomophila]MDF0730106.1 dihydrolipoyllysine-residue acetyltransferase [Pseudomonas entomophila]